MFLTNTTSKELFETIKKSQNIILFIDARYDYDAFCSALSIHLLSKRLFGKNIKLAYFNRITDEYKKNLLDIVGELPIETEIDPETFDFSKFDLHIFSDSGDVHKILDTGTFKLQHIKAICIDHHIDSNKGFGDLYYIAKYCSTCSVIYKLMEEEGIIPTEQEACLLLVGLLSDAQFFTIQSAQSWDFYSASKLLELSQKPYGYFLSTFFNVDSLDETKMKALAYKNMVIDESFGLVYSYATLAETISCGIDLDKKFDVSPVDLFFKIKLMRVAFFIKEQKDTPNTYSVSFRSRGDVDVVPLAKRFGGGGHKNAAGGILVNVKNIETALGLVLKEFQALF